MAMEPQGSALHPPPEARRVVVQRTAGPPSACPLLHAEDCVLVTQRHCVGGDSFVRPSSSLGRPVQLVLNPLCPGLFQKTPERGSGPAGDRPHQDQLPVIGQLPGPGGLGALSLQKPLLADHFVLTLPLHQALQERGHVRGAHSSAGEGPSPRGAEPRIQDKTGKRPGCGRREPRGPTLQGLPSTVCSSNSSPILKLISVVRTVVEVLM